MHILIVPTERFVSDEDPISGIFQYHQALALHRAGIKVGLVAPAPRSLRGLHLQFHNKWVQCLEEQFPFPTMINQSSILCPGRFTQIMQLAWNSIGKKMLRNYMARFGRPDLIHAHNVVFAGVCCRELAKAEGIPYVITEHSSGFSTGSISTSESVKAAFREAGARIMVSPFLGTKVEEKVGKDASPWEYLPNILEPRFAEGMSTDSTKVNDTFQFLCVAQFVPIKNHNGLIHAFASAFRGKQNIELVLGGSGLLMEQVRALAESCGVSEQVKFLGALSRDQVVTEMHKCDALVLPSFSETFGVVLIEAMACGKPVIAPSGSGCEAIVNLANGVLFRPGDISDLANALVNVSDLAGQFNPLKIRKDCLSRFGESTVVSQLLNTYERVLSTPKQNKL